LTVRNYASPPRTSQTDAPPSAPEATPATAQALQQDVATATQPQQKSYAKSEGLWLLVYTLKNGSKQV